MPNEKFPAQDNQEKLPFDEKFIGKPEQTEDKPKSEKRKKEETKPETPQEQKELNFEELDLNWGPITIETNILPAPDDASKKSQERDAVEIELKDGTWYADDEEVRFIEIKSIIGNWREKLFNMYPEFKKIYNHFENLEE